LLHSTPTAEGEPVDPSDDRNGNCNRRLTLALRSQFANEACQIVCADGIETSRIEPWPKMAVHDASLFHLGRVSKVEHRTRKPSVSSFAEAQLRVRSDVLTSSLAGGKVVSQLARGEDPTIDRSPAQPAGFVPEADLEHSGRTAIDGALYPHTPGSR
jgi:hypothetical protein